MRFVLFYFLAVCSVTSATGREKILDDKIKSLSKKLSRLEKRVSTTSQFCETLPGNVCGPCLCRDDRRTLKQYFCDCQHLKPRKDCREFHQRGMRVNGLYKVNILDLKTIQVFCDQTTDGGGWTVIQRRVDGSETFYRDWDAYKRGFGDLQHEHWLGNENLHRLDLQSKYGSKVKGLELRIDMTTFAKKSYHAKYHNFQVGNEVTKYKLHLSGFSGNTSDSLLPTHDGMKFSTYDADHDTCSHCNCAKSHLGGWWYKICFQGNLNGHYYKPGQPNIAWTGIHWRPIATISHSLKRTEMKIRRKV